MTDLKLTPARIALLRAISDPAALVYAHMAYVKAVDADETEWASAAVWLRVPGNDPRIATPQAVALRDAGLIALALYDRKANRRALVLTEAGEQVLADHDAKERRPERRRPWTTPPLTPKPSGTDKP